jgi:hypothetical protein
VIARRSQMQTSLVRMPQCGAGTHVCTDVRFAKLWCFACEFSSCRGLRGRKQRTPLEPFPPKNGRCPWERQKNRKRQGTETRSEIRRMINPLHPAESPHAKFPKVGGRGLAAYGAADLVEGVLTTR